MLSRRRIERGERGVALVEFALIFPVFMTLVLGMFSGGMAYDRKITMTNAAREGARYGATLNPVTLPFGAAPGAGAGSTHGLDTWLFRVADAVQQNAEGDLDAGVEDLEICVAYVHPNGPTHAANPDQAGHALIRNNSGSSYSGSGPTAQCYSDGGQPDDRRVQVQVTRRSNIQLLFFRVPVTLTSRSVVRFEAVFP